MANTITSPNMSLPIPVVSVDPGPDYAANVDSCLSILDSHNHTPGYGVQVPTAGININADLTFQSYNAIGLRTTRFNKVSAPLTLGSSDVSCLYAVNNVSYGSDLYFNTGLGVTVPIVQNGVLAGTPGSIAGLPSGTASVTFSGGTYTFLEATATPAVMSTGPITIARAVSSAAGITITPSGSFSSPYTYTLPDAPPGSNKAFLEMDSSGVTTVSTVLTDNSGAVTLTGTLDVTSTVTVHNQVVLSSTNAKTLTSSDGSTTYPFVVSPAAATNCLKMVRGYVDTSNVLNDIGEGWTHTSGINPYVIGFTVAFLDTPVVVVSNSNSGGSNIYVSAVSSSSVSISGGSGLGNFSFIAIGQRG